MQELLLPVAILAGIGLLSGLILAVAAKYMAVPVDDMVHKVREALPGANCGACGFAGCDEYAVKLVEGDISASLCTPGGNRVAQEVGELLGIQTEEVLPKRAIVKCAGTVGKTEYIMDYQGPQSCEACNSFYQGRGRCSHACLGYGDCVLVCQYDAIHIVDGIAMVDPQSCTGCGMCAKVCPNFLIEITPMRSKVYVACSSTDSGAFVRKVCSTGCIGCRRCEKACEYDAITITDNLARIDPEKCTNCGACVSVCPTTVIRTTECGEVRQEKHA